MKGYREDSGITFTRSRRYRKNDSCFVEQKNWSVVRRFFGYACVDTDAAANIPGRLNQALGDDLNFVIAVPGTESQNRSAARTRVRTPTPTRREGKEKGDGRGGPSPPGTRSAACYLPGGLGSGGSSPYR